MMNWEKFEYSKNKVRTASKKLVKNDLSFEEKTEMIGVLANFRSSHAYPMQSMIGLFRKEAFEVNKQAIVVRRLKRIPSIIAKLKREPTMDITRMGDIGGIRIILENVSQVHRLKENLLRSSTKNKLKHQKDYITHPKESGYRSVHLTYAYQGSKSEYKGFKVELQIRSKIQHAWATAVEVMGNFYKENLKASQGNSKRLDFFKQVSQAFAFRENKETIDPTLMENIKEQMRVLKILDALKSFALTLMVSEKEKGFYLLELDIQEQKLRVGHEEFLEKAQESYRRIEQEIAEDNTKDVVLVAADSLKALKKAYPNYWADTRLFIRYLNAVTGRSKSSR